MRAKCIVVFSLFSFFIGAEKSLSNCGRFSDPRWWWYCCVSSPRVATRKEHRKNGRKSRRERERESSTSDRVFSLSLARARKTKEKRDLLKPLDFSLSFEHSQNSRAPSPLSFLVAVCTGCPCRLGGDEIGQSPGLAPVRPDDPNTHRRFIVCVSEIGRKFLQSRETTHVRGNGKRAIRVSTVGKRNHVFTVSHE